MEVVKVEVVKVEVVKVEVVKVEVVKVEVMVKRGGEVVKVAWTEELVVKVNRGGDGGQ